MPDDAKLKANRIVEALERNGLLFQWSKIGIENVRATIVQVLGPEQPTFEALALAALDEPPDDGWPKDYQDQFWQAWPKIRRQNKLAAMKALDKIRKSRQVAFEVILAAVEFYGHEMRNKEKQFILHPSTWLNGHRWEDEHIPGHLNGRGEVKNGFLGRLMEERDGR